MQISNRLWAKITYNHVSNSLFYSERHGYTLIPKGQRDVSSDMLGLLYAITQNLHQVTKAERQELIALFPNYTLRFSGPYWMDMRLKPEYYNAGKIR